MSGKRILALCLFLLLLLSACTPALPDADTEGDYLQVTDALGRALRLRKNPQRVAVLLGSFADVWVLAGGNICATANDAWEDFGLSLPDATNLGGAHSPSMELLLASNPELVIASASTASHVQMRESLEALGIAVIYFDVAHLDDYLHMLDVCTALTGRRDLYEANGLRVQEAVRQCKESLARQPLSEQERTILLLRASSTTLKAKGSAGTVLGEMLKDLGCINIADSDKTLLETLSMERILELDPHRILVITMGNDPAASIATLQNIMKENPAWESLRAVREGRLHYMDRALFNLKPNARWALAYETLIQILRQP